MRRITFTTIILLLLHSVIYAGHPLVTDDVTTIGKNGLQFELTPEFSSATFEYWTNVPFIITYGFFDHIDVVFGIPYVHYSASGTENVSAVGLADMSFQIKWLIFQTKPIAIALKSGMTLPSGDYQKGLGAGKSGYNITIITSHKFDNFTFHLNSSFVRNENIHDEVLNLWHFSMASEYPLFEKFTFVANIGLEKNEIKDIRGNPAFVIGGIVYSTQDGIDLDAGLKLGLNRFEPEVSILTGITIGI